MKKEILEANRGTFLRKNSSKELKISFNNKDLKSIFLVNGVSFKAEIFSISEFTVNPNDFYMILNNSKEPLEINYDQDILNHSILYDPYKFENSEKINLTEDYFKENYNIQDGYIGTLPKWYSFKFTYPEYNIIFVKPGLGISIQVHQYRTEYWEILEGKPIVINGTNVYYFVESGKKFKNSKNTYHSIINPNKDKFIVIKENWSGKFDETDITRVFNPNQY